LHDSFLY